MTGPTDIWSAWLPKVKDYCPYTTASPIPCFLFILTKSVKKTTKILKQELTKSADRTYLATIMLNFLSLKTVYN